MTTATAETIARSLAARDSVVTDFFAPDPDGASNTFALAEGCVVCDRAVVGTFEDDHHAEDCAWVLARQLYPQQVDGPHEPTGQDHASDSGS